MLEKFGIKFTKLFLKYMPNAFVFAIVLTILTGVISFLVMDASVIKIIESWYKGFFDLLSFGMQVVLIVITGFSIALSPAVNKGIDYLTNYIKTPKQVYFLTILTGGLLSIVSFGWIVITCVFARLLATKIKGVNYPFLVACVYFSSGNWVTGLSSSIPLLLNTEKNYLIETGILTEVIPTSYTLGSSLNLVMMGVFIIIIPLFMLLLVPKSKNIIEISDIVKTNENVKEHSIKEEALNLKLPYKSLSDNLNNSQFLQLIVVVMGFTYIIHHFITNGFNLNFNIMIFIFLIVGLLLHKTPMRYVISMKRSSENISGILFQYPFYAGIMGIMLYTGLGVKIGELMASAATLNTYPFYAYITGGLVNFAIPSAGGEFAVVGPSIINAVTELGQGLPKEEIYSMISRASMSIAYGESLSNMLQPFYLLLVMPIMGANVKLEARDVMGYLVIPFIFMFLIQIALVVWWPI